jgi:hypothetical protein
MYRNKTRFNRLADGFGSALGKHAEWRKPALSKMNSTASQPADLGTRESLLTPGQQRQRSQSSVSQLSTTSVQSSSSGRTPEAKSLAEVESRYREESQMVKAAQEAVMQRPNFAIDAIGDSDGEDDEEDGGDDSGVMDEVEAFLKAHGDDDEGLTGEQKKVAEGKFFFRMWVDRG